VGYLLIFFVAWFSVSQSIAASEPDDPHVVIDKTLGYLTAMFLVPHYAFLRWPWLWGLFLFLLIDFIRSIFMKKRDKKEDKAIFVLVDDLICGILACFAMWLVAAVHTFLSGEFVPLIFAP
jgi:phosphatidylglycerophosphatase A